MTDKSLTSGLKILQRKAKTNLKTRLTFYSKFILIANLFGTIFTSFPKYKYKKLDFILEALILNIAKYQLIMFLVSLKGYDWGKINKISHYKLQDQEI